jgi:hypothetical protein
MVKYDPHTTRTALPRDFDGIVEFLWKFYDNSMDFLWVCYVLFLDDLFFIAAEITLSNHHCGFPRGYLWMFIEII